MSLELPPSVRSGAFYFLFRFLLLSKVEILDYRAHPPVGSIFTVVWYAPQWGQWESIEILQISAHLDRHTLDRLRSFRY